MRGRMKQRSLDNIKNNLSERELSGEEAQDRVKWKRLLRNIHPHIKVGKDAEEEIIKQTCLKQQLSFLVFKLSTIMFQSVYRCDFLQLDVVEPLQLAPDTIDTYLQTMLRSPIERLPRDCFHVIVFSLLLEYLPAPHQRWQCCQKAQRLLMVDGLLLIVTPDSHSQHRNAPMMRSWKGAIESLGFRRCRYIKQEHLHCLAFRKIESDDNVVGGSSDPDMLYIPQDTNNADGDQSKAVTASTAEQDAVMLADAFKELPNLVS